MRKFFVIEKKNKIFFKKEDFNHLKVLRIKVGQILECINNKNELIKVKINGINPYFGELVSNLKTELKDPYCITCYMGIIKKHNFELVVEKLNEMNIKEIYPVYFRFSQHNYILNYDRLKKIVEESNKQCNRISGIEVKSPISFKQFIDCIASKNHDLLIFCNEKENTKLLKDIELLNYKNIAFIIGPEGGFDSNEIKQIEQYAHSIKLTNTILKSETSALYIASNIIERFCNEK